MRQARGKCRSESQIISKNTKCEYSHQIPQKAYPTAKRLCGSFIPSQVNKDVERNTFMGSLRLVQLELILRHHLFNATIIDVENISLNLISRGSLSTKLARGAYVTRRKRNTLSDVSNLHDATDQFPVFSTKRRNSISVIHVSRLVDLDTTKPLYIQTKQTLDNQPQVALFILQGTTWLFNPSIIRALMNDFERNNRG